MPGSFATAYLSLALVFLGASAQETQGAAPSSHRIIIQYATSGTTLDGSQGLSGLEVVPLFESDDRDEILAELQAHPDILHAEPDYEVQALAEPNDSRWSLQGSMRAVRAPEAWEYDTGSADTIVCVIDTGIDPSHNDLALNMHPKQGYNAITGKEGALTDDNGHGTHCAGVAAAMGNNTSGVSGVSWRASLLGCKFLDSRGIGYISGILSCLDYCIRNGATISSNSYSLNGLDRKSSILREAISQAASKDHLFVTAAGNSADDNDQDVHPGFPAAFGLSNMLSVASVEATNGDYVLAPYSSHGPQTTHIAAPGTSILSTWPGNYLAYLTGTSMAAPHVAGAAALLRGATDGKLSNMEIRRILLETARNVTSLQGKVATGMLDVGAAMRKAVALIKEHKKNDGQSSPMPDPAPSPPPIAIAPPPQTMPPPSGLSLQELLGPKLKENGVVKIILDLSGSSCVSFRRSAQSTFLASIRAAAAVQVRHVKVSCKGPYLSKTDPNLQATFAVSVRKSAWQALRNLYEGLVEGSIAKEAALKLGTTFGVRNFKISFD